MFRPKSLRTVRSASAAEICFSAIALNAVSRLSTGVPDVMSHATRLKLLPISVNTNEFVLFSAEAFPCGPSNSFTSVTTVSASIPVSGRIRFSNSFLPRFSSSAMVTLGTTFGGIGFSIFKQTRNRSRRTSTYPLLSRYPLMMSSASVIVYC